MGGGDTEEPRGCLQQIEELSATFQPALFQKKLEPLKAKHNDQYIDVYIWTVYVIHDAAIGTLFLRSRLASSL